MTEYQYYVNRGLLKTSLNFDIGNLHITMLDYKKNGKYTKDNTNIVLGEHQHNIVIAHQYFKFEKTQLPNFGDAILLDNNDVLYGTDYLICGHVHHKMVFDGLISNGLNQHKCNVEYVGCMMRPAYRDGFMDEVGSIIVLTLYDDGKLEYNVVDIPLWEISKSFNIEEKAIEEEKKAEKEARVDISDIVKQLDSHERNIGNPEDIIDSLVGVDEKYKNKAKELLKNAL